MDEPSTRRRVLRSLAAGAIAVAGCVTDVGSDAGGPETATLTSTRTPTATPRTTEPTTEPETTDDPYPDVDEREKTSPPGSPALSPSGEWPSFRFDAGNTGYAPDGSGLRDAEPYWRLNAGGPPVLAGGALFNLFRRGRDYTFLTRRDPGTATVSAETRLVGYGTNSPPTVAGGRVFVNTFIEVFCLAVDRDEVLWRSPEMDGIQGAPTVHDGTVFVNSGGFDTVSPHVRAFDAKTGEEQWRYETGSESKSTPAVGAGAVFVDSRDGLHAVEAATGERRFVVEDAANAWGTAAVSDERVYVVASGGDGESGEADGELLAIDANDGTIGWRAPTREMDSHPPVVTDDLVWAATGDGMVAFEKTDGSRSNTVDWSGLPTARAGDVLYATGDGRVAALDVRSGNLLWSHRTERVQVRDVTARAVSNVTPVDGAVYVSAWDGFYGFGPPTS